MRTRPFKVVDQNGKPLIRVTHDGQIKDFVCYLSPTEESMAALTYLFACVVT